MKNRDETLHLEDILEAIGKIENYTRGLSKDTFIKNNMVIDACVRNLE